MFLKICSTVLRPTSFIVVKNNKQPIITQLCAASQRLYCSHNIGVVDYTVIKKLPNEPHKLLIDVREPDELKETGQIPSSINIPLGIIEKELSLNSQKFEAKYGRAKPQENSEIIFHCKIGKRSLKAAQIASSLGFKNLQNYEGSWLDWAQHEGLPK